MHKCNVFKWFFIKKKKNNDFSIGWLHCAEKFGRSRDIETGQVHPGFLRSPKTIRKNKDIGYTIQNQEKLKYKGPKLVAV